MFRFKKSEPESGPDVSDLNQIRKHKIIKPGYKQDLSRQRVIEFAYLPDDQVLLLGSMDGQYPYWASVTDVRDTETNAEILNRILFDDFNEFTGTWPDFSGMMWHRYRRRFLLKDGKITTPFDYGISSEPGQSVYWGRMMAGSIHQHWRQLSELCRYRELDGRYLEYLKEYLKMMQTNTGDDVRNYEDKKILIRLIESEDYLYQSQDEKIRKTYIKIRDVIGDLYNRYMTIVR
ncbi:MAG: hypothetical protein IKE06_08875 [Solobacterium sp.]|nr:hypothetical protein [Solobacterium sp.]